MSKKTRFWLVTAVILIVIGVLVFITAIALNNWKFNNLFKNEYVTNTYDVEENFSKISIDVDTANINFFVSDDGKCKVICDETDKIKHTVNVENDTLSIKENDDRKWYNFIKIFYDSPEVTLYLPKTEFDTLTIKNSTGNINVPNTLSFNDISLKASTGNIKCYCSVSNTMKIDVSTGDILISDTSFINANLYSSTGDIKLENINASGNVMINTSTGKVVLINLNCNNLETTVTSGNVLLTNVIINEQLYVYCNAGNVKLNGCDASSLKIKTSTGDVKGTLLSDKIFIVDSSTGDINVPKTTTGGICEITTSTGDITIQIQG